MRHRVILVIRDGWGYRKSTVKNALIPENTPETTKLMKNYPTTLLDAAGEAVGLPDGYQGNSEVGHMTIGSGRIIYQSLARINKSIENKSFYKIPEFLNAIKNCKKNNTTLHIMGLLQTEGVHAHRDHLFTLLDLCKKQNFSDVKIHVFTDGRDAPVTASIKQVTALLKKMKSTVGEIATIQGRYYAMDRDRRWERTKKAYDCVVNGTVDNEFEDPIKTIKQSHSEKITDEFIKPRKKKGYAGVKENDSIIFYNFRTDRPRQLTKAIVEKKFEGWQRQQLNVYYVAMTQYYEPMNAHVAFKEMQIKKILGEVIAENNLKQLRISETEKYAHVTFFFNSQTEKPFRNEERILIHSPKVPTYDLKPEMSVYEIKDRLIAEIKNQKYDFIAVNLVNGDMVGHTGNWNAIVKAAKAVDECVGQIAKEGLKNNYTLLITADHGNAEDKTPKWGTSHTTNKVPFTLVSDNLKKSKLKKGKGLKDIAPTIIKLLEIKKPKEMTGESLI